jgi:hypothetical protein
MHASRYDVYYTSFTCAGCKYMLSKRVYSTVTIHRLNSDKLYFQYTVQIFFASQRHRHRRGHRE